MISALQLVPAFGISKGYTGVGLAELAPVSYRAIQSDNCFLKDPVPTVLDSLRLYSQEIQLDSKFIISYLLKAEIKRGNMNTIRGCHSHTATEPGKCPIYGCKAMKGAKGYLRTLCFQTDG